MGIHKGTKLTDTPKDYELKFRMDAQTREKLDVLCKRLNKTKAQVIRDGIEKQYAEISKK